MAKALRALYPSKSPGPDGIYPRVLKELGQELAFLLKLLFYKSMQEGSVPSSWNEAEVRSLIQATTDQ